MRRYTVPVLFAFILLMSMFTSLSGSSQAESLSGIGEWDLRDIEPFDWSGWDQDTDDNGIDDLLQGDLSELDGDGELIGINIHFSHYPAPVDVQRIVSMVSTLQFHHVGKYSTAAYLSIPGKDVPDLLSLMNEDITMLEYRPPMVNSLDISTPATRSGQSEEYSPMTAWELGYSGEGMVVAVIDSGVDNSLHESLRGKFVFGVDFTGTTVIYGLDPDDIDGHGTHVAGTVMGTGGAAERYMGTAPDAELVDLRYARIQGDFTGAADRALEWVIENHEEHDISVTSCSWGSTVTTSGKDTTSRLVDQLVDEGVVVVVAAGNDGEQGLPSPASADGALTIGALDDRSTIDRNDDGHDGYSNRGPRASDGDLDTMDEMKPDVIAPGRDIRSAKHNSVMEYVEMTGTSMATPHVSGIVALMLQANPGLTPSQVKGILRDTAQQKRVASMPEKDDKYNYRSGWGAVDAFGAVKRAGDLISYEVQAPSRVRLDLPFQANVTGHFTKTDHDTQDDVVEMELLTPLQWGPPSDVDLDPGVSGAEVTLGTPSVRGGMWSVRGSVRYAGSVEDVEPVLHAEVRADGSVGDVRTIEGTVSINDVEGSVGPTNVSISYDSLPPDLSIVSTAIWFSDNLPESGDQIDIHARVNNTGGTDVSSVLVRFMDGPERTGRSIGEDIIDVDAFSSAIASSTWEANPGIHAITVIADPENDIAEPDEDNNSAERPITVRGINPPPIAQLEVSPGSGKTITSFFFDASGSTDTNLRGGAVVLYNFDFGDGDSTGWIEDQQVEHLYHSGGSYTASLIVEDNGGAKSQNGANVQINVSEVQSNELTLYLNASSGLSEGPGPARSVLISNGEIGTWSSEPFQLTTILHTEAVLDLKIWSGEEQGITLAGSIGTEHDTFSSEWELEHPGGGNVSFTLGIMMDETEVRYLDTFSLLLEGTTNSEDAMLLAGKDGSMMKVYSYIKENTLPEVDAGPDMDVKAEQEVTFVGSASDTDSGIYWTRWDFDGDGEWDSEGDDALSSDHSGYEEEGSYTARLEVTDRDGGKASDTARVTVRSSDFNYPPSVTMICPSTSEEGILHLQGSSDDDGIVEVVEVRIDGPSGPENGTAISWTEADGTDPWTYSFDTRGMSDGSYTVYARAYDDERYSEIASCSVQIENPNSPPVIERIIVAPRPISLDGEQQLLIKVDISDPDLPMDDVLVSSNLSIIGGPAEVILRDDGTGPDADEEDGTYTLSFIPPISAIPGTYMITITAVDLKGASVQDLVMVEMVSALEVDVDIQDGPYRIGREYLVKVSIENGDTVDRVEMKIGNRTIELKDDGKEGDRVAGDDTYSRRIEIEADPGIVGYEFLLFSSDGSILHSITGELRVEEMLGSSSNDEKSITLVLAIGSIVIIVFLVSIVIMVSARRKPETVQQPYEPAAPEVVVATVFEE